MISMLRSIWAHRIVKVGALLGAVGVAALLIILWQVGVFEAAPPPASLQAAVESVREQQQESQAEAAQPAQQSVQQEEAAEQPETDVEAQQDQPDPPQQSAAAQEQESEPQQQQAGQQQEQEEAQAQSQAPDQTDSAATADSQEQEAAAEQPQEQAEGQSAVALPSLTELAGSWVLSERGESFVGYRIGEVLARVGTTTAVGRTGDVTADLQFDGSAITSVTIVADLRTLRSDESFRDNALRMRGIESDTYPFATFTLSEPIPIASLPTADESLAVTVSGTLELHGVTNDVAIELQGQYLDGLVVVVGSTEILLEDYAIEKPTGFSVVSIEDSGIMEFQLVLERSE